MKCRSIQNELIFYLDNELVAERTRIVEQHLNNCACCRDYLTFLQSELHLIIEEKNQELTPFFYTRLSVRLEEGAKIRTQRSWIRLLQPALFTLLLILGIYGGIQIGNDASSTIIDQNVQSAMQIFDDFESEPIESFLLDIL
jgi:predicted anti-sigma-YlaC factor YlaD